MSGSWVRPVERDASAEPPRPLPIMALHRLALKDAADALNVIERILDGLSQLQQNLVRVDNLRARQQTIRAELEEVANWVQLRIAETWKDRERPRRRKVVEDAEHKLSEESRRAWLEWSQRRG